MSERKRPGSAKPARVRRKKPYRAPKLEMLGTLAELTRSNLAGQNDSFFGTGGDQTRPEPPPSF